MNVSKIGQRVNRVVLPMTVALALTTACAKNNHAEEIYYEKTQAQKENTVDGDILEIKNQKNDKKTYDGLLHFLLGFLGMSTILGLSQARAKRVEHDVKQKFYENNPSIVKFEKIEGEKETEKFIKRRDKLRLYLSEILKEGLDSGARTYTPNIDEYLRNVNAFTKYYPDRKALLLLGILPFADTRLKPEERGFVFSFIYAKATDLDSEWRWEESFKFLDSSRSYDEILGRMILMRKRDAQIRQMAEAERAQAEAEAEREQASQTDDSKKIMFKNVGGQDKAIEIIKKNVLFPIKYPKAFEGTKLEHGLVLYGPPGTGKTLLAEALSNEADAHFIKINGPELESKWVGETEENWRNIFDEARENQPSIIFIDEFDSIASKRGSGDIHGDKALNQLLGLISDIKPDEKIFLLAATNRLDTIDPAFIRSGRFGTHIELKAPSTIEEIMNIFTIHSTDKNLEPDLNIYDICKKIQKLSPSGADIAYIVNDAREKAMTREQIYEKMEDGTFQDSDIENLTIKGIDFNNAIDEFYGNKFHKTTIGFGK